MPGTANQEEIVKSPGSLKARYGTLMMGEDENGVAAFAKVNSDGKLAVDATLEVGDIEIGAVEIKDSDSDNRVTVDDNGALKVTGGASSVAAEFMSPSDFSANHTSSTTITLSALPMTVSDSSQLQFITVISSAGVAATYVNGANGVSMTVSSNVITISGVTTPFASGDVYQIGINAQKKAFDASTNSNLSSNLNPEYSHNTSTEHFIDEANVAAGTYRKILDVENYPFPYFGAIVSGGVTLTIWREVDPDADDTADTGWERDTTLQTTDLIDAQGSYACDTKVGIKRYMVKYVTTDATNAIDMWVTKN